MNRGIVFVWETVGDWIRAYEAGGIEGLLKMGKRKGSESSLPEEVIEGLKKKLGETEGFGSYKEIVRWVKESYEIETTYWVVYYTVREKLGGRLAVARRSQVKKKEAEEEFKTTFERRVKVAVASETPVVWDEALEKQEEAVTASQPEVTDEPKVAREVKVFFMDESRFGLMTIARRRITLCGVKPTIRYQHAFENTYLYGAVEAATGTTFFLELPDMDTICFQLFLDYLAAAFPNSLNILVLDNASIHHAKQIVRPAQIRFIFTPPYTPEVNSMERVWEAFKSELAGEVFDGLAHLSDSLIDLVRSCIPEKLRSLTFFPYMRNAINAMI